MVCKLSLAQLKFLQDRGAVKKKQIARLKKDLIEKGLQKQRRKELLKVMEKESKTWLYPGNTDQALKDWTLIPNTLTNQSDYYVRLQEKAIMVSMGQYDEMEESKLDHRVFQYKNSKLIPLYANLTGLLTRLRQNEIERIYEEYEMAVEGLKESGLSVEAAMEREAQLSKFYEMLILKLKRDMNQKKVKLKLLEEKLLLIFNVLTIWREYTGILNMPYEDVMRTMNDELER